MKRIDVQKLSSLQRNPANIRNVCILAHVDHGEHCVLSCALLAYNFYMPILNGAHCVMRFSGHVCLSVLMSLFVIAFGFHRITQVSLPPK